MKNLSYLCILSLFVALSFSCTKRSLYAPMEIPQDLPSNLEFRSMNYTGQLIAYTRGVDPLGGTNFVFRLHVMNANGKNDVAITQNFPYDGRPNWSPDGQRLTFTSNRLTDGNPEIYIANPDGTGQLNQTNYPSADYMSVFSPDGEKIAFISDRQSPGIGDVFIMDVFESVDSDPIIPQNLTQTPSINDALPSWSPDGSTIVFQSYQNGSWDIHIMDVNGNYLGPLTDDSSNNEFAAWSPDGTKIAFRSDRDGNGEIYIMTADGSNPTRLTNYPKDDYYPAWSPNSQKIAFCRLIGPNFNYDIFVMKDDGTKVKRLTDNPGWDADPNWVLVK